MKSTPSYKRRRVELNTKQQRKISNLELREGLTYQTAVDDAGYSAESIQEIPPPLLSIQQMPLPAKNYTKFILIWRQVAAVCGQSSFSMYVKPETHITSRAEKLQG